MADLVSVPEYLTARRRPGCGVMVGRTGDGLAFELFWMSGRDVESMAQAAATVEKTIAVGPASGEPTGRWAVSIRRPGWAVVGNGFDVEAAGADLAAGVAFAHALRARAGGPGASGDAQCLLAAVRMGRSEAGPFWVGSCSATADDDDTGRVVCEEQIDRGRALVADACGDRLGLGAGATPVTVLTQSDLDTQVQEAWRCLDADQRVMVVARAIGPSPAPVIEACR